MATIAYTRTSTADQEAGLADQVAAVTAAGADRVFSEHVSSVEADRPELKAALAYVREGDTFLVTKPDRLARSIITLLTIVGELQARGVAVRILSMNLDTTTPTGKMVLSIMGAVAEFERDIMLERQRCGIAAAKAAGKYKGKKPQHAAKAPGLVVQLIGGARPSALAREAGIGRTTLWRMKKAAEKAATEAEAKPRKQKASALAGPGPRVASRSAVKQTLIEFLAVRGLKDEGGELRAMDCHLWHKAQPFRRRLIRPEGRSYESALQAALDAGFFPVAPACDRWSDSWHPLGEADLIEAVRKEMFGEMLLAGDPDYYRAHADELESRFGSESDAISF